MKKKEDFSYREEAFPKTGRDEDARFYESREVDSREIDANIVAYLHQEFHDPLAVDNIPAGVQYYWARDNYVGVNDFNRIASLRKKGFVPVPSTRHPELVVQHYFPEDKKYLEGLIYNKGAVLVERPLKYKEIEDKINEDRLRKEMQNIPVSAAMHDPSLGLRVNDYDSHRSRSF